MFQKHIPFAPQCLSQAKFLTVAKAHRVCNHGRKWQVFIGKENLGFADGNEELDALVQVHRREVNNALYFNESIELAQWMPNAKIPSIRALKW